jgi:hypothetical protein
MIVPLLFCILDLEIIPTLGAKKKEKKAIKEDTTTIHGPVGMEGATKEI